MYCRSLFIKVVKVDISGYRQISLICVWPSLHVFKVTGSIISFQVSYMILEICFVHFILCKVVFNTNLYRTELNPYPAEPKVICFCHQYRARPACTSMKSDQALYCWLAKFKYLDIPKNDNGQCQKNGKWIIPFKKSGRLSVNKYMF